MEASVHCGLSQNWDLWRADQAGAGWLGLQHKQLCLLALAILEIQQGSQCG